MIINGSKWGQLIWQVDSFCCLDVAGRSSPGRTYPDNCIIPDANTINC